MIFEYGAGTSKLVVVRSHCSSVLEWNENVSRVANQETKCEKYCVWKKIMCEMFKWYSFLILAKVVHV